MRFARVMVAMRRTEPRRPVRSFRSPKVCRPSRWNCRSIAPIAKGDLLSVRFETLRLLHRPLRANRPLDQLHICMTEVERSSSRSKKVARDRGPPRRIHGRPSIQLRGMPLNLPLAECVRDLLLERLQQIPERRPGACAG